MWRRVHVRPLSPSAHWTPAIRRGNRHARPVRVALQQTPAAPGMQEVAADAARISTGGAPLILRGIPGRVARHPSSGSLPPGG